MSQIRKIEVAWNKDKKPKGILVYFKGRRVLKGEVFWNNEMNEYWVGDPIWEPITECLK